MGARKPLELPFDRPQLLPDALDSLPLFTSQSRFPLLESVLGVVDSIQSVHHVGSAVPDVQHEIWEFLTPSRAS